MEEPIPTPEELIKFHFDRAVLLDGLNDPEWKIYAATAAALRAAYDNDDPGDPGAALIILMGRKP